MSPPTRRAGLRDEARRRLRTGGPGGTAAWADGEPPARQAVFSLLCDADPAIRDLAAEAVGGLAAREAGRDMAAVRETVRRLLWSMNDEAGSLIHHAPQAVGAILSRVPELIEEYRDILASFSETDPFREGVRSALARLAQLQPGPPGRLM